SGIPRVANRLEERGVVQREPDPADGRAALAVLTRPGLEALRRAQSVHHATVRELYLDRLARRELEQLAALFEKAQPGVVTASTWPPRAGDRDTQHVVKTTTEVGGTGLEPVTPSLSTRGKR